MQRLHEQATNDPPATAAAARARRPRIHPLAYVLALGVVARLLLWLAFADQPVQIVDARDYQRLATGLATAGRYMDEHGKLTSLRPPLYPAMAAVVYKCFGIGNLQAVRAMDAIFSLLTVVVLYHLGSRVYSPRVGLWAAAAVCFYPSLLGFNNLLLSEPLFTLLVTLSTLLAVRALQSPHPGTFAALGIVLGLGALTRSVLWLFSPVLALYLLLAAHGSWRMRLLGSGLMLAACIVTIAPWSYRNTKLQKTLTFIDVMGGRNVMMGNYEYTPLERSWATIDIARGQQSWNQVLAAETPGYSQLTQGQIDKLAMKRGVRYFFAHPTVSLQRCVVKFFNFWQLERTIVAGASQGLFGQFTRLQLIALALIICGSYATAILSGIFGLWMAPPSDWRVHVLLLLTVAFPCALHTAAFAHSRYHLPLIPIVLLYAASALLHCRQLVGQYRHWTFWAAALTSLALIAGWLRELIFVDPHL